MRNTLKRLLGPCALLLTHDPTPQSNEAIGLFFELFLKHRPAERGAGR